MSSEIVKYCDMSKLPLDLFSSVLLFLNPAELNTCSKTSKTFKATVLFIASTSLADLQSAKFKSITIDRIVVWRRVFQSGMVGRKLSDLKELFGDELPKQVIPRLERVALNRTLTGTLQASNSGPPLNAAAPQQQTTVAAAPLQHGPRPTTVSPKRPRSPLGLPRFNHAGEVQRQQQLEQQQQQQQQQIALQPPVQVVGQGQ